MQHLFCCVMMKLFPRSRLFDGRRRTQVRWVDLVGASNATKAPISSTSTTSRILRHKQAQNAQSFPIFHQSFSSPEVLSPDPRTTKAFQTRHCLPVPPCFFLHIPFFARLNNRRAEITDQIHGGELAVVVYECARGCACVVCICVQVRVN